MNLWCDVHGENHRLSPSAVERIVYALQGMVETAEGDLPVDDPQPICLNETLRLAAEGYRGHVDALRERRLRAERTRKPQLRGRRP